MASEDKPLCKFGEKCYRKNPQHLSQFRHPKKKDDHEDEPPHKKAKITTEQKGKRQTLDDFFGVQKKETVEHGLSDKKSADDEKKSKLEEYSGSSGDENSSSSEDEELDVPESPEDVKQSIKQKFLVEMPEDFYQFWEFCKAEKPEKPTDALVDAVGLQLVGPFDILAGKHKGTAAAKKRSSYLLHWRYYYDPPEFQTVIRGDDSTQFHLGYFRDDPNELPALVASNKAKEDCVLTPRGDNLFSAVRSCIDEKVKSKETSNTDRSKLEGLSERLKACAKKNKQCMDLKSKNMKERDKKVVCKSFHKCGIVVPVDENEVGYREVPETPADLKKMFKKIADSKTESEKDKNYEPLQELITLVQFANDECDYGEGLELGIDLFCYGGSVFHSTILQLLPMAYTLLHRPEYGKIIEAHLKSRRHDAYLSQF